MVGAKNNCKKGEETEFSDDDTSEIDPDEVKSPSKSNLTTSLGERLELAGVESGWTSLAGQIIGESEAVLAGLSKAEAGLLATSGSVGEGLCKESMAAGFATHTVACKLWALLAARERSRARLRVTTQKRLAKAERRITRAREGRSRDREIAADLRNALESRVEEEGSALEKVLESQLTQLEAEKKEMIETERLRRERERELFDAERRDLSAQMSAQMNAQLEITRSLQQKIEGLEEKKNGLEEQVRQSLMAPKQDIITSQGLPPRGKKSQGACGCKQM